MIRPLHQSRLPRPRPRLERRAARGHPRRLHATAASAAPTRPPGAPSPTCPPCRLRAPPVTHRPRGGQPKATREALCPACCPQRSPLVTRPPSQPPMRWVPLPLDSRAALLPVRPFPICLVAHRPISAALPYPTQRRRRRIDLAGASAPPRGLQRCYSRAIRRCVRRSGIDSAALGGEMDLYRSNWRRFWAVYGGFVGNLLVKWFAGHGVWGGGGVGSDLGVGGGCAV
jgi:hypothetical protein